MYKLTVTCKGAKTLIGEFIGWHQLEQLVSIQANEIVWNWFDSMIKHYHILELSHFHLVTTASNGMTVVYSIEDATE
jgi:hypothetical protein